MNRKELESILIKERISPLAYPLYSPVGNDNRYILEERFGTWYVYFWERGLRTNEQIFSNEDEACRFVLDQILNDPTSRPEK
jgi:hypothetical protein